MALENCRFGNTAQQCRLRIANAKVERYAQLTQRAYELLITGLQHALALEQILVERGVEEFHIGYLLLVDNPALFRILALDYQSALISSYLAQLIGAQARLL